ncbi:MAG: hypothetical protein JSS75_07225 [Bacteroidetes bacterium]|nr:hypothetical protein [Bacteroidota bacterium]
MATQNTTSVQAPYIIRTMTVYEYARELRISPSTAKRYVKRFLRGEKSKRLVDVSQEFAGAALTLYVRCYDVQKDPNTK